MAAESANSGSKCLDTFLRKHAEVKLVRLHWVDYSGVLHCRIVTIARLLKTANSATPYKLPVNCISIPLSTWPNCDVSTPQVWELHPEWTSLRFCGYSTRSASIMCFLTRTGAAEPFSMCPRQVLAKEVHALEQAYHAKLLVGFEIEFVLLNEQLQIPKAIDRIEGFSTSAGLRGTNMVLLEEILDTLEACDIPVHQLHTEDKDQLEISLEPAEPMKAIDDVMHAQEAIRTISIRHNRKATMIPKPFLKRSPTNGLHMHISISMNNLADAFLSGILTKLRVLSAFGLPNYDSYHRVADDGTGRWVGWGTENRELPVRRIESAHWEYRAVDTTANLYLLLAVLVRAGSMGIEKEIPLVWKDCRIFPQNFTENERAEFGLLQTIPGTLKESVCLLKIDPDIRSWIGHELLDKYIKVKEKDAELFAKMSDEERRQIFLAFF